MTRDQAVTRIKQILGFRRDLDDEAADALREAQEDAENGEIGFLPWFLKRIGTATIAASENIVVLPNSFIREYEHERNSVFIEGYGPAQRVAHFSVDGVGSFRDERIGYYIDESRTVGNITGIKAMVLDTTFTESINVEYLYYSQDADLTEGGSENLWLRNASKWIIGAAGMKLSGVRNVNAVQSFGQMKQEGASMLLKQDAAYRTGATKYQFGKSEDRDFDHRGDRTYVYNDTDLGD